jgi:hypothetical protein
MATMAKHALVNQPTRRPTAKITAAGIGGLLAAFVLGGLDALDAMDLPTLVDGLVPVVSALVAGYFKKARASEQ